MKSILLIVCFLSFGYSFGQQKLLSSVSHQFNPDSTLAHKDSISHIYYGWQGSIDHLKPVFKLGDHALSWEPPYDQLGQIPCEEEEGYNFNPLNLVNFTEKICSNGLVIESADPSYRFFNFYDANNNLTQRIIQQNVNFSFQSQDCTVWNYDNLNNMISQDGYFNNSGTWLNYSAILKNYVSGTSMMDTLTFLDQPASTGSAMPNVKYVVTYNNTQIAHIDRLDFGPPNYNPNWSARFIYTYTAGNISNWKHCGISNGQLASTSSLECDHVYDTQNQLLETQISGNGTILKKEQYQYDSPGFISKYTSFDIDSNNSLFKQIERDFTYQNTLGMDEIENIEAQIFPNPTSDYLTIVTDGEIKFVQILNLTGQVLIEQNSGEGDVRHLAAGTYVIKGMTSDGNFSTKIIKK